MSRKLWQASGLLLVVLVTAVAAGERGDRGVASQWRLRSTAGQAATGRSREHPLSGLTHVRVVTDSKVVTGLLWGEGAGYVAVLRTDGQIELLKADSVQSTSPVEAPFMPVTVNELIRTLSRKLPWRFRWYRVGPYVIASTADASTSRLVANTLRKHYVAYRTYMQRRGLPFQEPVFPLPVLVFGSRAEFVNYATRDLRKPVDEHFAGYYSLRTNRAAFTLEGTSDWRGLGSLTHEVTHQLTYNTGFLKRFAHYPRWFLEGFATYFEVAGMGADGRLKWNGIGAVNSDRLEVFQAKRPGRLPDSIRDLVLFDRRFSGGKEAVEAYAEAWALTYFLAERRPRRFRNYLKILLGRPVLREYERSQRLEDFVSVFGEDFKLLDRAICTEMDRLAQR